MKDFKLSPKVFGTLPKIPFRSNKLKEESHTLAFYIWQNESDALAYNMNEYCYNSLVDVKIIFAKEN